VKSHSFDIILKIFYYHPLDDESNSIWNDLSNMNNLYVIHLKRRNILRSLVSRKIAGMKDQWKTTSNDVDNIDDKAVTFSVEELEEAFSETREWERNGDERFKNHPMHSVYYEDLVNNPEATFGTITDFLDLHSVVPETKLKKQNTEKLRDLVKNYDELKLAFSKTEWESFFEE